MISHFVIRSHTFLSSSHTFSPAFHHALFFCYTFLYVLAKFSYVPPCILYNNLSNSDTFFYVLCDSHADSAISIRIPWLWPPPSPGSLLAILCQSCSLLSSHTFSYTFLYVPGRPITSWSYGISGPPTRRPTCHPITPRPTSCHTVLRALRWDSRV